MQPVALHAVHPFEVQAVEAEQAMGRTDPEPAVRCLGKLHDVGGRTALAMPRGMRVLGQEVRTGPGRHGKGQDDEEQPEAGVEWRHIHDGKTMR
ncbi:hypothetical protein GCM10007387_05200 [Pseudoduganella albidiflava]|uniref:Uncharacterized protein n=1 Tax=Pseudoduganella albidiflava TaxID=321983 RepID=A0AA88C0W2_9BURK|nr:hypothetical protein GCM10007387_05200 [Pseudoduganella albidiflava]